MSFNEKFINHLTNGSALSFKNLLLGEDPSLSKTLATYLIAPLFVVAYPLFLLTYKTIGVVFNENAPLLLRILIGIFFAAPAAIGFLAIITTKIIRETLRVVLAYPTELLNIPLAFFKALFSIKVTARNDQSWDFKTLYIALPNILLSAFKLGEALWSLGLSWVFHTIQNQKITQNIFYLFREQKKTNPNAPTNITFGSAKMEIPSEVENLTIETIKPFLNMVNMVKNYESVDLGLPCSTDLNGLVEALNKNDGIKFTL